MKTYLTIISAFCLGVLWQTTFADVEDGLKFGYHSVGIDTYADRKTPVRDGECYALVWIRDGFDFKGFKVDGSLVDGVNNAIAHVAPLASEGRCPPACFIVGAAFTSAHKNGTYKVVVLDTRCAQVGLLGVDAEGRLRRVNGWGWAKVKIQEQATKKSLQSVAVSVIGSVTETASEMPEGCRTPVIVGFDRLPGGGARVRFTDSETYNTYCLALGSTLVTVGENHGIEVVDGCGASGTATLTVQADELPVDQCYIRVERKDWLK